ncbi:MAG: hypothetical protein IIW37_00150 [Bacteroidaceae bacterium]|nr:hypothetical protein [Bacteroidaceae bacterium]
MKSDKNEYNKEEEIPVSTETTDENVDESAEPSPEEPERPTEEAGSTRETIKALKKFAAEDDEAPVNFTWRSVLGGEILAGGWLRKQFGMIVLITICTIVYISNRYSCQQEMITAGDLVDTLLDRKYKALTCSSELLEKTLRSNVEEGLADSTIQTSTTPHYSIKAHE